MRDLSRNEYAMLELLALQPLSCIPPLHRPLISQLSERGLTMHVDAHWYATATALKMVGRSLH